MYFLAPWFLWLLPALALLPVLYLWLLGRRRKLALRYSRVGLVRDAVAGRQWRRHVPATLLLLALGGLLLAGARPVGRVTLPWARTTLILAMDTSLSMRVADILPTRMEAAQEAAKRFLRELPRHIEVGIVSFAGSGQVAQRPTLDRSALVSVIDGLRLQMGTAVGDAIVLSVAELFPEQGIDVMQVAVAARGGNGGIQARSLDERSRPPAKVFTPVAAGSNNSAAIVLLSDGRRTTGVDALAAAKLAAERGVRIHVVGLGTAEGGAANVPEGMAIYLQLDEPTLKEIARVTGGEYYRAGSADELRGVYAQLGSQMHLAKRETELSSLFMLASAVLALAGAALSLKWFGRLA